MKKLHLFISLFLVMITCSKTFSQSDMKEFKAGHIFYISLPDYMSRTTGLNSAATIQYKSEVKDVYGFVIEDNKEELKLAELNYTSLKEFYEDFIKDFLKDEDKRKISKEQYKTIGTTNFVECEASYYDLEAKVGICYIIGIVETPSSYYKILSWSTQENKEKFKADFQKIIYSLKD